MIHWALLFIAIVLEVAGTTFMKLSDGLHRYFYSASMLICYLLSLTVLSFVLKHIPIGIAYAIWSACGIVLIASIGFMFF
jgi:small multidrug resistance pump